MLTELLPNSLDVRKVAARGAKVSGTLKPLNLPRFLASLADDSGSIQVDLAFFRDEEARPVVEVTFEAQVSVVCQRCLQAMPLALAGANKVMVVWTDDQAKSLPRHLEPLIVPEDGCNLWELVEEELILAMPPFSYHDTEDCLQILSDYTGPAPDEGEGVKKPNPFDVLVQLK